MLPHSSRPRAAAGFTLVEIMIVIFIIGILISIAAPVFVQARESSRAKSCVSNLHEIESAKERWAMDTRAGTSATPDTSDLITPYLRTFPMCPQTNTAYQINNISTPPTCAIGTSNGTNYKHVLP